MLVFVYLACAYYVTVITLAGVVVVNAYKEPKENEIEMVPYKDLNI